MSIVSYAQNYEDVMLWRALQHVKNGYYIDVGANDPVIDSVTKLFYDNGWSGINIEPLKNHCRDLENQRVRDINLNCAAGDQAGEIEFWECDVRGWATADPKVMETHEAAGYKGNRYKVPVLTLSSICEEHAPKHIHFLKVDVEGFEKAVLQGMDFSFYRPWILLVEATKPNSPEENYSEWEGLVTAANYSFAYSDGLNRFYVANEKEELLSSLKYPPNVFDEFIRVEQLQSEIRAQKSEAQLNDAEAKAGEAAAKICKAEAKANEAETRASEAEANLNALIHSRSWRITAPMRALGEMIKNGQPPAIRSRVKLFLQHASLYIHGRPRLKRLVLKLINRFPRLKMRLVGLAKQQHSVKQVPIGLESLTPHGRRIYQDLKCSIETIRGQR